MKKLALLLTMVPLAALADVANRQRDLPDSIEVICALGVGMLFMVGLFVHRKPSRVHWMEWIVMAMFVCSACMFVVFVFRGLSVAYEEYKCEHCRTCGTKLVYLRYGDRYCPKCEPERNPKKETETFHAEMMKTVEAKFSGHHDSEYHNQ